MLERSPTVRGHGFRECWADGWYRKFFCECGLTFGQRPRVSRSEAVKAHREHKAAVSAHGEIAGTCPTCREQV